MREGERSRARARGTVRLLAALAAAGWPVVAQQGTATPALDGAAQAALESIRVSSILPTIRFLAAEELEGREAGERGERIAADYIVSRFEAAGVEPGTKDGYRQRFDLRWRVLGEDASFAFERRDGDAVRRRDWEAGRDYSALPFSDEGTVAGPLVFAGYGIAAPEHDWDDYAALGRDGARGKIVVVWRHEPDEEGKAAASRFEGAEMSLHASLRQKVRAAVAHGAVGLILIDDPRHEVNESPATPWRTLTDEQRALPADDPVWFQGRPDTRDAQRPLGLVAVHASQQVLSWLDPDRDWAALQRQMEGDWKPIAVGFPGIEARIEHDVDVRFRSATNVVGMVRGADPTLAGEYVLVGAHFDHVGVDDETGEVYNGADDNASGTAAVVALAEAFAALPQPPKRSVLFVGWAAEEKGLLGSNWFVHHPPLELEKVVAAINLDMVGRNDPDEISVVGRGETPDLVELFDRFAGEVGLQLNDDAGAGASRSDNASLWLAGIPTASLFSGTHEDYHEPSDDASKIVGSKVERAARLSFLVMHAIASGDVTPAPLKVPDGPWEPIAPASRRVTRDGDEGVR